MQIEVSGKCHFTAPRNNQGTTLDLTGRYAQKGLRVDNLGSAWGLLAIELHPGPARLQASAAPALEPRRPLLPTHSFFSGQGFEK